METLLGLFSNVFYIIIAVLVLLFMITVHELGHFIAGKVLKFKINEFAIGFGPAIYKRTSEKTGEVFSVRCLPLGGYCAFEGEDQEKENPESFNNQKPWKRIIVFLAGVFMNFMAALLIAIIVFSAAGMYFPSVNDVFPDAAGVTQETEGLKLQKGDIIIAVNGEFLYLNGDLKSALSKAPSDKPFTVTIVRNGIKQDVSVKLREYNTYVSENDKILAKDENGNLLKFTGLGIWQGYGSYRFGFFESIANASVYCIKMAGVILGFFFKLITGQISLNSIGGPITTIDYTAQVARHGLRDLMEIVTLIGVNLAVFNLLPIPALDGSKVVFILIEMIRKKPIKRELEGKIHMVGLFVLFAFVIIADLLQLLSRL